jgi:hypothetical protein
LEANTQLLRSVRLDALISTSLRGSRIALETFSDSLGSPLIASTGPKPQARSRGGWLLAVVVSLSMTLIGQKWVAGASLYAPELWESREVLHNAILHNQLPDSASTWVSKGANGLNVRLLTVWAAEGLHRLTGMRVQRAYLWIESASLLACGLLLYAFLESYVGWQFALGGLLYWGPSCR